MLCYAMPYHALDFIIYVWRPIHVCSFRLLASLLVFFVVHSISCSVMHAYLLKHLHWNRSILPLSFPFSFSSFISISLCHSLCVCVLCFERAIDSICLSLTRARNLRCTYTTSLSTSFKRSTVWLLLLLVVVLLMLLVLFFVRYTDHNQQYLSTFKCHTNISLFWGLVSIQHVQYKSFLFTLSFSLHIYVHVYVGRCIGTRATMNFLLWILWLNSSQPHKNKQHTHTRTKYKAQNKVFIFDWKHPTYEKWWWWFFSYKRVCVCKYAKE